MRPTLSPCACCTCSQANSQGFNQAAKLLHASSGPAIRDQKETSERGRELREPEPTATQGPALASVRHQCPVYLTEKRMVRTSLVRAIRPAPPPGPQAHLCIRLLPSHSAIRLRRVCVPRRRGRQRRQHTAPRQQYVQRPQYICRVCPAVVPVGAGRGGAISSPPNIRRSASWSVLGACAACALRCCEGPAANCPLHGQAMPLWA